MNEQTQTQSTDSITLNVQEVLSSLNIAQQEAQKWIMVANTLSKCATFINSLIEQQKQQVTAESVKEQ